MWQGSSRPWRHKLVTWRSGPGAHDSHFCYIAFSLPACKYALVQSSLWYVQREREDSGLVDRLFCILCKHHLKVDSCRTRDSLCNILEGWWWREMLSDGRILSSAFGCWLSFKQEMARWTIISICGLDSGWNGWSDISEEHDWNWWPENLKKRYIVRPLREKRIMKICVSHVNAHQSFWVEDFNNLVDRMTHYVDTSPPFPPKSAVIAK